MSNPRIQEYRFGRVVIDGRAYTSDVIIHAQGVEPNWWRARGHSLGPEDLQPLLDLDPEVLVVGTGASGLMTVPQETRQLLRRHGIQLVVEQTEKACTTYNQLSPSRRTVAALHLTC